MSLVNLFEYSQACAREYGNPDNFSDELSLSKQTNPHLERFRASIKSSLFHEDTNQSRPKTYNIVPISLKKGKIIASSFGNTIDVSRPRKRQSSKRDSLLSRSSNNSSEIMLDQYERSQDGTSLTALCAPLNDSSILDDEPLEEKDLYAKGIEDRLGGSTEREEEESGEKKEPLESFSRKRLVFLPNAALDEIQELKEEFKMNQDSKIKFIEGDFNKYYKEEDIIGEGTSGLVKRCTKIDTNEVFAVKIIQYRGDKELLIPIIHEFENLKKLDHKNIIKVSEVYIDYFKKKVFTLMEFTDCKEMFDVLEDLGHYSEAVTSGIIKQILKGLKYLHSNGVCYRDIKPNNILVSKVCLLNRWKQSQNCRF